LFLGGGAFGDFDDVEADSFGKRPAFADRHNVALRDIPEARRAMSRDVLVTFFKPFVLPDEVQVIPPHNNRSLHLHFLYDARQNSATNLHETSEGTFLVDINAILRLIGSLEAQTDVFAVANLLGVFPAEKLLLSIEKDVFLLLKRAFRLIRHILFGIVYSN